MKLWHNDDVSVTGKKYIGISQIISRIVHCNYSVIIIWNYVNIPRSVSCLNCKGIASINTIGYWRPQSGWSFSSKFEKSLDRFPDSTLTLETIKTYYVFFIYQAMILVTVLNKNSQRVLLFVLYIIWVNFLTATVTIWVSWLLKAISWWERECR